MITPSSGYILPWHGVVIGALAGALCYWFCIELKHRLRYDDSLDVFGVHGVGGLFGSLMPGIFATAAVTGDPMQAGLVDGRFAQLGLQAVGVLAVTLWCVLGTWLALKATAALVGLRASNDEERQGLDLSMHGEALHQ
jgi:Amt family ammonium transporter